MDRRKVEGKHAGPEKKEENRGGWDGNDRGRTQNTNRTGAGGCWVYVRNAGKMCPKKTQVYLVGFLLFIFDFWWQNKTGPNRNSHLNLSDHHFYI